MKTIRLVVLACGFVVAVGTASAQGGPGAGMGPGASAPGAGMGAGMRGGRGPGARAGADYTPGWTMMTPAERSEHMNQMRSMKTLDECKAYVQKHHDEMAARAKEKGAKVLAQPRRDPCAGLKP
ncbi:MAG: hypothetical protein ABI702_20500 [Burkholderiales bacterium]